MNKCVEEEIHLSKNESDLGIVLSELYKERYGEDLPSDESINLFLDSYRGSFFVDVFEDKKEYAYYISGLDMESDGYDPEIAKDILGEVVKESIDRLVMFFYESKCSNAKKPIDSQEYLHKSKSGEFYLITCASEKSLDDLVYEVRQFHKHF